MSDDRQNEHQKDGSLDAADEGRMIRIMQYCDGVLPAREAALVAEDIARDPEAAQLAAELSSGANAARVAWGNVDSEPVPFDLARRVTQSARRPIQAARTGTADWRMAAALVVGAALGMLGLLVAQHGGEEGLRLAGADNGLAGDAADSVWQPVLMSLLAKDPEASRATFSVASGAENEVSIARWFNTEAGLRCAEFSKSTAGAVTAGGIACKKPDGGWDVIEQPR
jgi:hypothetical protein